uniref:ARAD1D45518p n=1 Tax=Blastobotrys adeninivorans TaxID=409370 RepID=A0A060TDN7_BLAAD
MDNQGLSPSDDGLAALQLPFLQSSEVSRFLSSSKDWTNEQDTSSMFEEVDNSPVDFFGHYSGAYSGPQQLMYTPYQTEYHSANGKNGNAMQPTASNVFLPPTGPGTTTTPAQLISHNNMASAPNQSIASSAYNSQRNFSPAVGQFDYPYDVDHQFQSIFGSMTPEGNTIQRTDSVQANLPKKEISETFEGSPVPHVPGSKRTEKEEQEIRDFLRSSKFLQFLPAKQETVIYDPRGNSISVDLNAWLNGNFFLSQPTGPSSPGESTASLKESLQKYELTFYRRNLFQVTASVSNAQHAAYAGNAENPMLRSRILSLGMSVGVTGSDDKKPTKLLYCPPKASSTMATDEGDRNDPNKKPPQIEPSSKTIYPKNSGYDEVVDWKRLQFRTATAHNGRKKLQNYFSVYVSLYAELENGQRVPLTTASSRPIVVRGRNPRFYQNRDNITLQEGGNTNREVGGTLVTDSPVKRASPMSFSPAVKKEEPWSPKLTVHGELAHIDHHDPDSPLSKDYETQAESNHHTQAAPSSSIPSATTTIDKPGVTEDHKDKKRSTPSYPSHTQLKSTEIPGTVKYSDEEVRENARGDAKDSGDCDYEYFPMPLNYWLPPVEVVYRPHAVHHPLKFPRGKSQAMIDNSKRYFSAVE